jgi:uncharacterized glyoxalase superfamily protein PhnB
VTYKLYLIRVFSFKWEESRDFYKNTVGFPLQSEDEVLGWAQFDLGSAHLAIERCDPGDQESNELVGRFVGTSIAVEDIQAVYQSLRSKGVEFTSPPEQQSWGGTLAHFKDPDGNIITLFGNGGT